MVVVPATLKFEMSERCPTVVFPTTDKVFEMVVAPPTESAPVTFHVETGLFPVNAVYT
jgi:hypothetical protein